jgi:hypothetical protein
MFALCALVALSEAGTRLFMPSARYGQPVQQAVASPQAVYYGEASGYQMPMEEVYYPYAAVAQPRVAGPAMNAVTERDADGNPVTHYEMFDPVWLGIVLVFFLGVLVKTIGM